MQEMLGQTPEISGAQMVGRRVTITGLAVAGGNGALNGRVGICKSWVGPAIPSSPIFRDELESFHETVRPSSIIAPRPAIHKAYADSAAR